ncbi:mitogen-activated protein kinase kinase kinase [Cryptotrichosporon argae]
MSAPPALTVSPLAGPSSASGPALTPLSASSGGSLSGGTPHLQRRPQGARRRAPGLVIANPDSSDDDGSPRSTTSGIGQGQGYGHGHGHGHGQQRPPSRASASASASPTATFQPTAHSTPSKGLPIPGLVGSPPPRPGPVPTIPAPQSTPLPHAHAFASMSDPDLRPGPPQPPPQPPRHFQMRSYTSPPPALGDAHHEPRAASASASASSSSVFRDMPASPSRALPPLPTQSPGSGSSPRAVQHPLPHMPNSAPAAPPLHPAARVTNSPEEVLSPVAASDSSVPTLGGRARAGSIQQKVLLQVTTDNDQFSLVDVTGVTTADGIRERIFSKLRFRDDDYATLSIFRTDFGEAPDPTPLSTSALTSLIQSMGDAKATLKLLVVQTSIPGSSAAPVIPPPPSEPLRHPPVVPAIQTDLPRGSHSKNGSVGSSNGGLGLERGLRSAVSEWSDLGEEAQIYRATRVLPLAPQGSASSRSPVTDPSNSVTTSSPSLPTPPTQYSPVIPDIIHSTPTPSGSFHEASSSAGPSSGAGLGLDLDGMDAATRDLIMQLQLEEHEEQQRRRAREEADAAMAAQVQQNEQEVWRVMQQQMQDRDEQQAREAQEEERRLLENSQNQADPSRRPSEPPELDRGSTFARERRERRERFQGQAMRDGLPPDWTVASASMGPSGPLPPRRPSEDRYFSNGQLQQSPPAQYPDTASYTTRRPPGFASDRFSEAQHAQDRLVDPRLHQLQQMQPLRHPAQALHPFGYADATYRGPPPLTSVRSAESLRPGQSAPTSRPPYQGMSPTAPGPPHAYAAFRSPSQDRVVDGRYPVSATSAPPRSAGATIAFPSPRATGSGSWMSGDSPPVSYEPHMARPSTVHYDLSPPAATSSGASRRPSTAYDDRTPPGTAQTGYFEQAYSRPRAGSAGDRVLSPSHGLDDRRGSESDTLLPYARDDQAWLLIPRAGRRDADTASVAGTVSSEATIRGRTVSGDDEDDSADTARAGSWTRQLRDMIHAANGATVPVLAPNDEEDEDEATLFITAPSASAPTPRRSPSRPNLTVNTSASTAHGLASSDSESAESADESGVRRGRSFARRDAWVTRPEPEQMYDDLDRYFPKIDMDKPFVDNPVLSTPSTPSSESPRQHQPPERVEIKPPPMHPSRAASASAGTPPTPKDEPQRFPPPPHRVETRTDKLKKLDHRKSIRSVANHKMRSLLRMDDNDEAKEEKEKKVKRTSSMWGHKVVEVTASKIGDQVAPPVPESPSGDGKPPTLNWIKGELIGKGSYGRVYIALNVNSGDMIAVKQVEMPATERDRQDSRQMSMVDALKSEISLLKDLYHPNIVAYLGFEASPEYLSIFLEYVPGGTIASIYRTPNQARFEEQLVKFFTEQILDGLAYLHRRNIWHRDLKGDNILVDAKGVCKISDFGISKQTADVYDSFGQATNMKGSVFWMAPEVIHSQNERTYSGKVDIWSLGCVVLEMWSGERPWGKMEQVAVMLQLFNRTGPPLAPDLHLSPVALDFLFQNCLATDPRERPMAVDLLQHPFITERDPSWTFEKSKIGKAVAKRGVRGVRGRP